MILKSDAKFQGKRTCGFKCDVRNLAIFHPATQKFENFTWVGMGSFYPKYIRFEVRNTEKFFHDTDKRYKI